MNQGSSQISDEMLMAYIDNELDEVNRRRVKHALAEDDGLAARLASHRRVGALLMAEYDPLAQDAIPDRLRAILNAKEEVLPIAPVQKQVRIRKPSRWLPMALAASLALGLIVGSQFDPFDAPVAVRDGHLVAQGALANTLDSQLASAQPSNAETRIGLSFRSKRGQWCRSFDSAALSGVACRSGKDWQLQMTLPGRGAHADYRQASSNDPRMIATIETMIADAPANAVEERAASKRSWR